MKNISAAYMEIPRDAESLGFIHSELVLARCPLFYEGRNEKREAESLSGYYLLLRLLKADGKTDFIEFVTKDYFGRPCFRNYPWLDFNISHASGIAVCALGTGRRVGIDTEALPIMAGKDMIAEKFFSRREKREYAAGGGTDEAFATVWTRKEAYGKYTGKGLDEYEPTEKDLAEFSFVTKKLLTYGKNYIVTLCSKTEEGEEDGVFQFFERIEVAPK